MPPDPHPPIIGGGDVPDRRREDAYAQVTRERVDALAEDIKALSAKVDRLIMTSLTFFITIAGSVIAGVLVVLVTHARVP